MPRPEKVQAVEEIKERFSDASALFITEYRGLTVSQQQVLRGALREVGATYKVFKMTLTRLAADELGRGQLKEYLAGPTAIAFAADDPIPVAKALKDFAAEHEALVLKAGWFDGGVIAPEVIAQLAGLESRPMLLAKILAAVQAPLTKMATMFGSMTRDAASVFSQLLDDKQRNAPALLANDTAGEEPADPEEPGEAGFEVAPSTEKPEEPDDLGAQATDQQETAQEQAEPATDEGSSEHYNSDEDNSDGADAEGQAEAPADEQAEEE